MSITFKAAILKKINFPLEVSTIQTTDLKVGQVLVKVLLSGLCGAQLQEIRGEKGNEKYLPHLLGHEGCGIVEEIGPGVTNVKKGDKVIMHWRKGIGIESFFPSYIYNNKNIFSGKVTTLSEYTIASENRLTPVPDNTPDELCTLLGCGLSTALGTINNDAKIKFGETVMILGCGGVGINLIQGAKLASATKIYGIDISNDKKEIVSKFGAEFINSNTDNITEIKDIDCIIDTTGSMELVTKMLPKLTDRGRCIIISQPKQNSALIFTNPSCFFLGEGQTISSTQGGKVNPSVDFYKYINLYNSGLLDINSIISHILPLDSINDAVDLLKQGKAGRILIKMV
jgi:S-(hydroxymethyl)glutathione dehydrogenase/alcohol dehydrogenase